MQWMSILNTYDDTFLLETDAGQADNLMHCKQTKPKIHN